MNKYQNNYFNLNLKIYLMKNLQLKKEYYQDKELMEKY